MADSLPQSRSLPDTPRVNALASNPLDSFDYRAWMTLAAQLERELADLSADYGKLLKESTEELKAARSETATPQWVSEELADGDKICAAAGVTRTEGGRLPVAKIINALRGRQVPPHRSGGGHG